MPEKKTKPTGPNLDFIDSPPDPRAIIKKIIAFEAWGVVMLGMTIVYVLGLSSQGGIVGETMIKIVSPFIGTVGSWILAVLMVAGTVHLFAAGRLAMAGRITKFIAWSMPLVLSAWECALHKKSFYWDK
ncbi:MAG TPA: hypothetical protein ENN67_07230, partial [Firmicutes bacterium]|nr:hypothetical protein [Bacillota bacterium]